MLLSAPNFALPRTKSIADLVQQLIYCVYRTFNKQKLQWYLEDCIALKAEFPELIAGMPDSREIGLAC
jgi:hypothetical protein